MIDNFLKAYSANDSLRLHMPGHKGRGYSLGVSDDITEISGADVLYSSNGIIYQSERKAAALFGANDTFFSAEGSTLCIKAMLAYIKARGYRLIAARNVHAAFVNACVLLDLDPVWVFSDSLISGDYTAKMFSKAILKNCPNDEKFAVYITSPDYTGHIQDVGSIAETCHEHGGILLVDNAHGAHSAFFDNTARLHPLKAGADFCCDSAHKTLPALTGAAYLHVIIPDTRLEIKRYMSLFGSTSPSYLILQSLDRCNFYLENQIREDIKRLTPFLRELKALTEDYRGLSDIFHVCVRNSPEVSEKLEGANIVPEMVCEEFILLLFSPVNTVEEVKLVTDLLKSITKLEKYIPKKLKLPPPQKIMSIREGFFHKGGDICSEIEVECPPCIPYVMPGELERLRIKN